MQKIKKRQNKKEKKLEKDKIKRVKNKQNIL